MKNGLETMRHSAAHLLAAAVKNLYPKTSLGIGPMIVDGFYYDFDSNHKFTEDDFKKIEKEIWDLKARKIPFKKIERGINSALTLTKKLKEPYKTQIILDLKKQREKSVTFYKTDDFIDLCKGPHVEHSGLVGEVKLLSVAGAYWLGDEKNKMLQRIYGTAWTTKDDLKSYLERIDEAKKRDHKKIGLQLGLFTFLPESPGMPYWYPKGFLLLDQLRNYIRNINKKYGYREISTPQLAKSSVWETSGHWELFHENMFYFEVDKQSYALKPMNCPQTILLYNTTQHSYKELPLKLSDLDQLHRYEDSGTLNGLFRVREMSQDDAHIFSTEEGVSTVVGELLGMVHEVYETFGFDPKIYLSTKPSKALGNEATWKKASALLEKALKDHKVGYEINEGEGSFYGPKIDLHIEDSLGRDWQLATIQLDMQMPARFKAKYTDNNGKVQTPLIIHRAILGSLERFLGILIEHHAGKLPLWLSPIQVKAIPIAERHVDYANLIVKTLSEENIRAEIDDRNETMGSKLRDAQLQKIPYMLIIGDKEQVQKSVSIRSREKGDEGVTTINKLVKRLKMEIKKLK